MYKNKITILTVFFLFWIALGWTLIAITKEKTQENLLAKLSAQNERLALTLSNELNRVRVELPKVQDSFLYKKLLENPSPKLIQEANRNLKVQAIAAKAESIFIADISGTIIAKGDTAAKRRSEELAKLTIGTNIAEKPYFQQASLEQDAEYYETNEELTEKVYHFCFPIKFNNSIIGVITLSYNLDDIYALLKDNNGNTNFLVGMDGVIYASSESNLDYKTLSPFSEDLKKVVKITKRYGSSELNPISNKTTSDFYQQEKLPLKVNKKFINYLVEKETVQNSSWILFSALKSSSLLFSMLMSGVFYLTFSALLLLVWLYLKKRSELQMQLANLNIQLEGRVEELTSGLKKSNVELKSLVSHYQTTQEKLEETQYELLQTARLVALGELSATLNHELSQPALALRAYTENSIKLLSRGEYEIVQQNFIEMHSICESMANIVSTIKNFARQSSDKMKNVEVGNIIKQSTPIVKHLIEKSDATIEYPKNGLTLKIRCIPEQIEQVIVNLISNACDAVNKKPDGKIRLSISSTQRVVKIAVRNNHSDVGNKELIKLFKPYYTTKKDGLGLGLVLCKRIIEAQDGRIKARICKDGDIEFVITLKKQKK